MKSFLVHNIKTRCRDGFTIGYNLVFPIIMIVLIGLLTKRIFGTSIGSFEYYSVVMFPFCTVLGLVTAAYAGKDDAYAKTAQRIMASPISKGTIVLSKLISCSCIFFLCTMLGVVGCSLVLHIPIWKNFMSIAVFYLCLSLLVSSMGTFVGLGMKNFLVIKNFISVPGSVLALLGGCFYPLSTSNPFLSSLMEWSLFYQINRRLFLTIYDGQSTALWKMNVTMILCSCVFAGVAVRKFNKEEYIHGDIPGYEK